MLADKFSVSPFFNQGAGVRDIFVATGKTFEHKQMFCPYGVDLEMWPFKDMAPPPPSRSLALTFIFLSRALASGHFLFQCPLT